MPLRVFLSISLLLLIVLPGCEKPFSYSPFEARVETRFQNTTAKNLERLRTLDTLTSPVFKIALISDTHYHFDNLRAAVDDINKRGECTFVIATGDITENGLMKEFEIFHNIMSNLRSPYVTVIGNHDYLANGGEVYSQMFGAFNYTFTFHGVRFIMFDNVIWESNKSADYSWLANALSATDENEFIQHKIVFSHIPPFDGQLAENKGFFHSMLARNDVKLSVHGHRHTYYNDHYFGDDISYVTVGSPQHRSYAMLTITQDQLVVEQISF